MMKHDSLKSITTAILVIAGSILFSVPALAHPSHDHEAPQSMLIHVLFYGSIVAALALFAWVGYRFIKQQKEDSVDD